MNLGKEFENMVLGIVAEYNPFHNGHLYHLLKSKEEFPNPDELITEFEQQGFKFIKRKDFLFGTISAQIMQKKPKELGIDAHLLKHL